MPGRPVGSVSASTITSQTKILANSGRTDGKRNRKVRLEFIRDPKFSVICPIRLLLILALRFGYVDSIIFPELLDKARARNDKTVVWTHPNRPVFCGFAAQAAYPLLEIPANTGQATSIIRTAGLKAGILANLVSQDLRRGSARDVTYLKDPIVGHTTPTVAASLGHSNGVFQAGVTQLYVGSTDVDIWSKSENRYEIRFRQELIETGSFKDTNPPAGIEGMDELVPIAIAAHIKKKISNRLDTAPLVDETENLRPENYMSEL
jgi:hypothetical protein